MEGLKRNSGIERREVFQYLSKSGSPSIIICSSSSIIMSQGGYSVFAVITFQARKPIPISSRNPKIFILLPTFSKSEIPNRIAPYALPFI